jgi:hypothetical protein
MTTHSEPSFQEPGLSFQLTPAMELMQYVETKMWELVRQYNLYEVKGVRTILLRLNVNKQKYLIKKCK